MKSFYSEVLGLPVKTSDPGAGYQVGIDTIAFETGEAMIELFDTHVHGAQLGAAADSGHRVVTALDVGDISQWLVEHEGNVRRLGDLREADWGTYVYVADSDGNPIQVYQEK